MAPVDDQTLSPLMLNGSSCRFRSKHLTFYMSCSCILFIFVAHIGASVLISQTNMDSKVCNMFLNFIITHVCGYCTSSSKAETYPNRHYPLREDRTSTKLVSSFLYASINQPYNIIITSLNAWPKIKTTLLPSFSGAIVWFDPST